MGGKEGKWLPWWRMKGMASCMEINEGSIFLPYFWIFPRPFGNFLFFCRWGRPSSGDPSGEKTFFLVPFCWVLIGLEQ